MSELTIVELDDLSNDYYTKKKFKEEKYKFNVTYPSNISESKITITIKNYGPLRGYEKYFEYKGKLLDDDKDTYHTRIYRVSYDCEEQPILVTYENEEIIRIIQLSLCKDDGAIWYYENGKLKKFEEKDIFDISVEFNDDFEITEHSTETFEDYYKTGVKKYGLNRQIYSYLNEMCAGNFKQKPEQFLEKLLE